MHTNASLFEALANCDISAVKDHLVSGADINGRTSDGQTVWSYVIPCGKQAIRLALQFGADPNVLDAAEKSALYWAIQSDDGDAAEILIQAGARIDTSTGSDRYNLLHEAAMNGAEAVLNVLLKYAPVTLLTEKNILDRTPYEEAVKARKTYCAALFGAEGHQHSDNRKRGYPPR